MRLFPTKITAMPLILKTTETINDIGTEVYIEFRQATGDYDATDNPGGFGAPNPARNTMAVLLWAKHKLVAGDQDATIFAYNPESVEAFTIAMAKPVNGVLNYAVVALPIFIDGGSYSDGDIVYDKENPAAPFIKEMVSGDWVEVTLEDIVGDEDAVQLVSYIFPIPDACEYATELNAEKLQLLTKYIKSQCGKDDYEPIRDKFDYVQALLRSAQKAFDASAFAEAQEDIEEIFKLQNAA